MGQLDNQIGFAEESTYGTRVVPTRFLEFNNEGLERSQVNRQSAGLRKGQKVQRSDRQSQANKGAAGGVELDLASTGFGMLLKHAFGKAPVIAQPNAGTAPTIYTQTHTLGDGAGMSLTTQVGRPGSGGTVHPYDYLGAKVASWSISQALDAFAKLQLQLDAQDEKSDQALATASYPASQRLFHDGDLAITVNGSAFHSSDSSISCDRQLALARFFQRASTLKKEPIQNALAILTGSLQGEFEDLTTYNLFKNGTIVPIVFTWTGPVIASTYEHKLTITLPACRLNGPKPVTSGPGILAAPTPFDVLFDGTNEPITLVMQATDSAI